MTGRKTILMALINIRLSPFRACLAGILLPLLLGSAVIRAAEDENGQPLPPASTEETAAAQTDQEAAPRPRVLPDTVQQRHNGVIDYLTLNGREYEMVSLVAGESEFHGLYLPETAGRPQGGVLILHDSGQHGHWPETIAPLREGLPASGWATLSIELPDAPQQALPPRPDYTLPENDASGAAEQTPDNDAAAATTAAPDSGSENQAEAVDSNGINLADNPATPDNSDSANTAGNGNEPALPRLTGLPPLPDNSTAETPAAAPAVENPAERYRKQMMARIRGGVAYLNQRGQLNIVVIAAGSSAAWATAFMRERPRTVTSSNGTGQDRGYALVLINASDSRYSQVPLDQQLSELEMPILDLVSPDDTEAAWLTAQRAGRMRHQQRQAYQQIEVPAFALQYDDTNLLARRIRGWLKTHAAGMELSQNAGNG